ncbi:hypothetical protein ACFFSW_30665 [Saccharothrix longispora]|uniref:Type VII secretion system (Wss) protein ESAT-6 n=1 Tax=Saccharothrix longispora TaxID=33920 RepID=A0ABU1PUN5_9PSEU|nr:hypothetical protein [Saccharothrix longispora]MDR6594311.1 hypothetical protein [Saccharothrix longispora]
MVDVDDRSDNELVDQRSDLRHNYLQDLNPLENTGVPDAESGTGFMTGITAFEAGWTIAQGVDQNDLGLIISGVAAAGLDVASAAVDPIAYVAGQLFSWMLEHVEPARAALHAVTGNPDMVKGYAQTWTNIEQEVLKLGEDLQRGAHTGVPSWTGEAAEGYLREVDAIAGIAKGAAGGAHGIAGITLSMAEVVGGIRVAIRDLLATLAGALVSWAIELAATLGAATPVVVAQATAKIAQVVRIVANMLRALGKALSSALTWLVQLRDLFDGFWRALTELEKSRATAPA